MKTKNNFRLKRLFLLSALFMFTIALALSVYATPQLTLNTATWSANTMVNISTKSANDDSLVNMSYVTIRFSASNTANSTSINLINITNTTATNFDYGYANFTFGNSIVLEDTAVGSVTGVSTGVGDSDAVALSATTITVDRTSPSAPSSVSPSGTNTSTTLNFTSTVTGTDTTGCTLSFTSSNPGQRDYAMTHSGNLCYLSISSISKLTYKYEITATDGTNSSTSSLTTVNIDGTGNQRRKAAALGGALGGGMSKEQIGKGLAIAQAGRAGEVSQGLAKAQAQISQFVERETQRKELTKTGIGLGTGVAIGLLIPTLVIPGVGLITAPILGGLIGAGIGIAI